jgi:predicted XRE-type DNA-binding protein
LISSEKLHIHTARIFRVARKLAGMTQTQVAEALKISQSTVSKYEASLLEPSAIDWFNFSMLMYIDSSKTLMDGFIDNSTRNDQVFPSKHGFKNPRQFRHGPFVKVREILPLMQQFIAVKGEEGWLNFLSLHHWDEDYFWVYDAPVSIQFVFEIMEEIPGKRFSEGAAKLAADLSQHGDLRAFYQQEIYTHGMLQAYVRKSSHYDEVLSYDYKNENGKFQLVLTPKTMPKTKDDTKNLEIYLNYKIEALRQMVLKNTPRTEVTRVFGEDLTRGIETRVSA